MYVMVHFLRTQNAYRLSSIGHPTRFRLLVVLAPGGVDVKCSRRLQNLMFKWMPLLVFDAGHATHDLLIDAQASKWGNTVVTFRLLRNNTLVRNTKVEFSSKVYLLQWKIRAVLKCDWIPPLTRSESKGCTLRSSNINIKICYLL